MGRYTLNEFITMRQEEARSGSSPRPSPPDWSPLLALFKVAMWIFYILVIIALLRAAQSGQPLDIDGADWL